jgi:hypothetical protein
MRQPGGPGAGDAHFVLNVVVAQAGLAVLPAPGVRHRWPDQETRKWSGTTGGTAMVTVGEMVSLKRVKGCVVWLPARSVAVTVIVPLKVSLVSRA